jgi:hypothetical protein
MAIKLENKVNTEAPSATYPFGNIKDNTGSNNGTPVDKNVYADFHQFFAKMMNESGIVYNDLPDNNTDGFQYWLALVEAVKNNCGFKTDISGTITIGSGFSVLQKLIYQFADNTIQVICELGYSTNILVGSTVLSGLPNSGTNFQDVRGFSTVGGVDSNVDMKMTTGGSVLLRSALTSGGGSGGSKLLTVAFNYKLIV